MRSGSEVARSARLSSRNASRFGDPCRRDTEGSCTKSGIESGAPTDRTALSCRRRSLVRIAREVIERLSEVIMPGDGHSVNATDDPRLLTL
jgi:hypothetical protein